MKLVWLTAVLIHLAATTITEFYCPDNSYVTSLSIYMGNVMDSIVANCSDGTQSPRFGNQVEVLTQYSAYPSGIFDITVYNNTDTIGEIQYYENVAEGFDVKNGVVTAYYVFAEPCPMNGFMVDVDPNELYYDEIIVVNEFFPYFSCPPEYPVNGTIFICPNDEYIIGFEGSISLSNNLIEQLGGICSNGSKSLLYGGKTGSIFRTQLTINGFSSINLTTTAQDNNGFLKSLQFTNVSIGISNSQNLSSFIGGPGCLMNGFHISVGRESSDPSIYVTNFLPLFKCPQTYTLPFSTTPEPLTSVDLTMFHLSSLSLSSESHFIPSSDVVLSTISETAGPEDSLSLSASITLETAKIMDGSLTTTMFTSVYFLVFAIIIAILLLILAVLLCYKFRCMKPKNLHEQAMSIRKSSTYLNSSTQYGYHPNSNEMTESGKAFNTGPFSSTQQNEKSGLNYPSGQSIVTHERQIQKPQQSFGYSASQGQEIPDYQPTARSSMYPVSGQNFPADERMTFHGQYNNNSGIPDSTLGYPTSHVSLGRNSVPISYPDENSQFTGSTIKQNTMFGTSTFHPIKPSSLSKRPTG